VRELAEEHLRNPGARGVPCARSLMVQLQAAVDGRPASDVDDERVYTFDEIVAALRLRKDGAVYRGPRGCEIDAMYTSRSELEPALEEGAAANHVLVTDPDRDRRRRGLPADAGLRAHT
jgi:hypothetical protein